MKLQHGGAAGPCPMIVGQTSWSASSPGLWPGAESETPPTGRSETCPTKYRPSLSFQYVDCVLMASGQQNQGMTRVSSLGERRARVRYLLPRKRMIRSKAKKMTMMI